MRIIDRSYKECREEGSTDIELICMYADLDKIQNQEIMKRVMISWEFIIEKTITEREIYFIRPPNLSRRDNQVWKNLIDIAESSYDLIDQHKELMLPLCTAVKVELNVKSNEYDFVKYFLRDLVEDR